MKNLNLKKILKESHSFSSFFDGLIKTYQAKDKKYSLRWFSGQLGYKNPSLLSDILKGKVVASQDFVERLVKFVKPSVLERYYIQNCYLLEKLKDESLKEPLEHENQLILDYWVDSEINHENVSSIDLMIKTYFELESTLTSAVHRLEEFFSRSRVMSSVEVLLNRGDIEILDNGKLKANHNIKNMVNQPNNAGIPQLLASHLKQEAVDGRTHSLGLWVRDDQVDQINEIMISALEKIVLLSLENREKLDDSEKYHLMGIFASTYRVG